MDVFVLSLLSLVIVLGCLGLRQEAQKKDIRNWSERFTDIYGEPQTLADPVWGEEQPNLLRPRRR